MQSLCFATNNVNKLEEIRKLIEDKFYIKSLNDIGCEEELPEDHESLEGNSLQKAEFVYSNCKIDCFADDTGLEVKSLNGAPGVYSARYAGNQRNNKDNIALLLSNLKNAVDKSAQFRTVITLVHNGNFKQFEGIVKGEIIDKQRGIQGFGYDSVFVPEGYDRTFAEMGMELKNNISHRGMAIAKLVQYLNQM